VEGHTCETENPRGFLAKRAAHRWFDQYASRLTRSDPPDRDGAAGSGSGGHGGAVARTAASGGGLAGVDRNRATGHDSTQDLDLDVENELANLKKGFLWRFKRQRRGAAPRGGRRRKACSGELLRAAQGTRTSTSNPCGFLTSTGTSGVDPR
jgi:hypothetical protein